MRFLSVVLLILSTLDFYGQNDHFFTIAGEILDQRDKGRITLNLIEFDSRIKSRVKNGNFTFEGNIPNPTLVSIDYKGIESIPFYIENSDIKLSLELKKIKIQFNNLDVKVRNTEKWVVVSIENCLTETLRMEYDKFNAGIINDPKRKELLFNYLKEQVEKYPDNFFYLYKLWKLSANQDYLSTDQLRLIFDKLDTKNIKSSAKNRLIYQISQNLKN